MSESPSPTSCWLRDRLEGVPPDFLPWLGVEHVADGGAEPAAELESRGIAALQRAMATPGRVRESAFHLLAADAFLTWSAEALLEHPDPPEALTGLLRRVAAEDE